MSRMNSHIELNRTFYELSSDYGESAKSDDLDIREAMGLKVGSDIDWNALLEKNRVILLAEAGAGKTEEIRQTSRNIRKKEKYAFFIRLEHIAHDFETSFEEGTYAQFTEWLKSKEACWLLLDSVDEARLKDPKDFERAIRTIAKHIAPALQRVHIIVTGRVNAWRPKSDMALIKSLLPYAAPSEVLAPAEEIGLKVAPTTGRTTSSSKSTEIEEDQKNEEFKVYSLNDLSKEQVRLFARSRGLVKIETFMDDLQRFDAWAYTTRPQDLEEIIEFWNKNERLGTRLELMQHSIERRLRERNPDHADNDTVTAEKARSGAKLLAAAATLTQESVIRIPDGSQNSNGIDAKSVLGNWSDKECRTLLGRPIFDEAIYGTVRFHHRSVREFLTAEWLNDLLKKNTSRRKIERLFFHNQYNTQVVAPSLRPILSWLVILDDEIRRKAFAIEPEVVLEGGDPNQLPLETRREILESVCAKISSQLTGRSVTGYAAVQRFAKADLGDAILKLLNKYRKDEDVVHFLLRLVWQGRIKNALAVAKSFAIQNDTEKYNKIAAIRAVKELGSADDYNEILQASLASKKPLNRRILSEIIDGLDASKETIDWIFEALKNAKEKEEFISDGLESSLTCFAEKLDPSLVSSFVKHASKFLRGCLISTQIEPSSISERSL